MNIDRAPSHDRFSRVVRMTDVETPGENISTWISSNFPEVCERVCGCKVLHVDGKAVRAAAEKSAGQKPVYNMNVMYKGEAILLYLKEVGEKENEISVLPDYLKRKLFIEIMKKSRKKFIVKFITLLNICRFRRAKNILISKKI